MLEKQKKLLLLIIIAFFTIIIYYLLLHTYYYEILSKSICLFLAFTISLTFLLCYIILRKHKNTNCYEFQILIISYIIMLFITLFYRQKTDNLTISNYHYIFKWFKLILTNDIVFINLLGNIIIFIPLGIICNFIQKKFILKLLFLVSIIICLELLQYISKRGVLDLIDIVLNISGGLIGMSIKNGGLNERREGKTRKQT